ncbi:hypothetical protein EDC01DRAFT_651957 [Geopyxis carbonaria]|nr:hypothetical protein EDC01DRAFT_651957 [Geopyxis carbonaria]
MIAFATYINYPYKYLPLLTQELSFHTPLLLYISLTTSEMTSTITNIHQPIASSDSPAGENTFKDNFICLSNTAIEVAERAITECISENSNCADSAISLNKSIESYRTAINSIEKVADVLSGYFKHELRVWKISYSSRLCKELQKATEKNDPAGRSGGDAFVHMDRDGTDVDESTPPSVEELARTLKSQIQKQQPLHKCIFREHNPNRQLPTKLDCGKLMNIRDQRQHMRHHIKPYYCDDCFFRSAQPWQLSEHKAKGCNPKNRNTRYEERTPQELERNKRLLTSRISLECMKKLLFQPCIDENCHCMKLNSSVQQNNMAEEVAKSLEAETMPLLVHDPGSIQQPSSDGFYVNSEHQKTHEFNSLPYMNTDTGLLDDISTIPLLYNIRTESDNNFIKHIKDTSTNLETLQYIAGWDTYLSSDNIAGWKANSDEEIIDKTNRCTRNRKQPTTDEKLAQSISTMSIKSGPTKRPKTTNVESPSEELLTSGFAATDFLSLDLSEAEE